MTQRLDAALEWVMTHGKVRGPPPLLEPHRSSLVRRLASREASLQRKRSLCVLELHCAEHRAPSAAVSRDPFGTAERSLSASATPLLAHRAHPRPAA